MYIEVIIIVNIYIHLIIGCCTYLLLNIRINKLLLFISSLIDLIYMVIYIYFPEYTLYIKYPFGIILSLVLCIKSGILNIIRGVVIYNGLNILLGGKAFILYSVSYLNNFVLFLLVSLSFFSVYIYKSTYKVNLNINELFYKLEIIYENKKIELMCYLDTGDFLVSDDLVNVIFINRKYEMGRFIKTQFSKSIGVINKIDLYMVDKIYLYINNKKYQKMAYISYIDLSYDGIFGIGFLGG